MLHPKTPEQVASHATDLALAGRQDAAIAVLRDAVKRWPRDAYVISMLGLSLIDAQPEEAKPLFRRATELAWNDAGLLLQAAQGMAYVGEWSEAARASDRAQDIAPAHFASRNELEHLRGSILLELDRPQEALPPLRSAYDRDPSLDGGAALADTYVQLERYRLAQDVIMAGLEHMPTEPHLLRLRAWLIDEGLWGAEDSDG